MTDIVLVYITCESVEQAKKIGKELMQRRLCACVNIFPEMAPMFFWPPKSGVIDESKEVVMIAKTVKEKYPALEKAVHELHSYDVPCVISIPTVAVAERYAEWLTGELE